MVKDLPSYYNDDEPCWIENERWTDGNESVSLEIALVVANGPKVSGLRVNIWMKFIHSWFG